MDNKSFHIEVEFGLHTAVVFDAVNYPSGDDSVVFGKCDEGDIVPDCRKCMIRIYEKAGSLGLIYDVFNIFTVIDTKKETDGATKYFCSNDLFDKIVVSITEC